MITLTRAKIGASVGIDVTRKTAVPPWNILTPTWDMIMGHKEGRLSDAEYTDMYLEILDKVDFTSLLPLIKENASLNRTTFMCYCRDDQFCHTQILIRFLANKYPTQFRVDPKFAIGMGKNIMVSFIGSRRTGKDWLKACYNIASCMPFYGIGMRSGFCNGPDKESMLGYYDTCMKNGFDAKLLEGYIPWPGYEKQLQMRLQHARIYQGDSEGGHQIASQYHDVWFNLKPAVKKLHARNVHILLGPKTTTPLPSDLCLCVTEDGCECHDERTRDSGGTGMGISIADRYTNSVVLNLRRMVRDLPKHITDRKQQIEMVSFWCSQILSDYSIHKKATQQFKERSTNIWQYKDDPTKVILTTTNSVINNQGRLVMGAGNAKAAKLKYKDIDLEFGHWVRSEGNIPCYNEERGIMSFPTKRHWRQPSSKSLIFISALSLARIANENPDKEFLLPPPGCKNGGLEWSEVKPILARVLPSNVTIVKYEGVSARLTL